MYLVMSMSTPFNKGNPNDFCEPSQFCKIYSFKKYLSKIYLLPGIVLDVGT